VPDIFARFKKNGILQTDFHMSTHYQVSQKSTKWERN